MCLSSLIICEWFCLLQKNQLASTSWYPFNTWLDYADNVTAIWQYARWNYINWCFLWKVQCYGCPNPDLGNQATAAALHHTPTKPFPTPAHIIRKGRIQPCCNYCTKSVHSGLCSLTNFKPLSVYIYSQILIHIAEWTEVSYRNRKYPSFETAAKGIRTNELPLSKNILNNEAHLWIIPFFNVLLFWCDFTDYFPCLQRWISIDYKCLRGSKCYCFAAWVLWVHSQ